MQDQNNPNPNKSKINHRPMIAITAILFFFGLIYTSLPKPGRPPRPFIKSLLLSLFFPTLLTITYIRELRKHREKAAKEAKKKAP